MNSTKIAESTTTTATGIIHEFSIVRCENVWRSGYVDVTYDVKHAWGEMEDSTICSSNHGYDTYERDTLDAAREQYEWLIGLYSDED